MGTIEKGAVTQTQALPSLTTQPHHPLPPDPNRIVGKKRFFLLMTPIIICFISLIFTLIFMGLATRGTNGFINFMIGLFITISATGVMFALSYIASVIGLYTWISKTKYGFNNGLWWLPIGTSILSVIPNVYPLALPYQRTFVNYLTLVAIGFVLTLVWVLALKGYLKYKKKTF